MLVSIAEHIGAPIGATTCPLRVTATTHTAAGEIAVTIQRTSGSATTDSGGITDSLTRRGGHAEGEAHQHSEIGESVERKTPKSPAQAHEGGAPDGWCLANAAVCSWQ